MADDMSLTQLPLTIIVAATTKNGIGKNNALPWPMLKKEMAYFARVTKHIPMPVNTGSVQSDTLKQTNLEGTRRNVVIMGRKTYESIPSRFRPLKDRTNLVISSQNRSQLNVSEDVIVASDILSALGELESRVREDKAFPVGRAFVIGGTSIYKTALELPQLKSILLTRIMKDFECDTFFPELGSEWKHRTTQELSDFVQEEVSSETITDADVSFQFQLWQKE